MILKRKFFHFLLEENPEKGKRSENANVLSKEAHNSLCEKHITQNSIYKKPI